MAALRGYSGPNTGVDVLIPGNTIPGNVIASAVPYTPPFTGGVLTTIGAKLAQTVSAIDFGADPTAANDSTANMIAAHATGLLIHYPRGVYKCTDNITIPGGGIVGDGAYQTFLNTTSTNSNNVFLYTGANAGRFENFQLQTNTGPGQKAGGYGITVGPASGEVSGMRFFEMVMNNLPNCVSFVRASLWSVIALNCYGFTGTALLVDNQNNGDSGDSSITDCEFTSPGNNSANAIRQVSSGGLKITSNKFNNDGVGYLLDLGTVVGGVSTSDLMITGNSFEGSFFSAIQLQRQGGSTATFQNVVIDGNQFLVASTNGSGIYSVDSSGFLSNVAIGTNVFTVTGTGAAAGILLDYVTNFSIDTQTMQGSGGSSVGISLGVHNVAGRLAGQQIRGFGSSVSASTGVAITKGDVQSGTLTVTTSTVYGTALFAGNNNVTFPTAYNANVGLTVADAQVAVKDTAAGGVSAFVVGITPTLLSVEAIGITSGGAVVVNWRVAGVI